MICKICYDTVPELSIYELYRPLDVDYVTLIHYLWNGKRRMLMDGSQEGIAAALAGAENKNWSIQ